MTVIAGLPAEEGTCGAGPCAYLAVELVGDERLPAGQGVAGVPDMLAMLEEEGVQPLVWVGQQQQQQCQRQWREQPAHHGQPGQQQQQQQGSCSSWSCTVTACSGAAYAIGLMQMASLHNSVLGSMYAETLARASGGGSGGRQRRGTASSDPGCPAGDHALTLC